MAEKYYPHDYLPMPLQDGYAFQPVSPLKRTEMTTGRARQRRAFISTPTKANVQWFSKRMFRPSYLRPGTAKPSLTVLTGFLCGYRLRLALSSINAGSPISIRGRCWSPRFTGSSPRRWSYGLVRSLAMAGLSSLTTSSTAASLILRLTESGPRHDHTESTLCFFRRRSNY